MQTIKQVVAIALKIMVFILFLEELLQWFAWYFITG